MLTLRKAIEMRLEDIREEKKQIRELVQEQKKQLREQMHELSNEQTELMNRLERMEDRKEDVEPSTIINTLADTIRDLKELVPDIPTDILIQKMMNQYKDNLDVEEKKDSIIPESEIAEAKAKENNRIFQREISMKDLKPLMVSYAKEHNNAVDHKEFKQLLKTEYNYQPKSIDNILWRVRNDADELISGGRGVTLLKEEEKEEREFPKMVEVK